MNNTDSLIQNAIQNAQPHAVVLDSERVELIERIKQLLLRENAVLVAHYYVDAELQALAEETGGFVGDSLEMARFGNRHEANTLVVAGVRFMGETAKILNPDKRILVIEAEAECSLDLGCPADDFAAFCDEHPDRIVVVYANTSAEVKARADWVVTSGIAVPIIEHLTAKGKKLLWAPDKHLGNYVRSVTGADMILWQASCVVHDEFRADSLSELMSKHPDAEVLVHPESPAEVIEMADVVGSTTALINAARESSAKDLIVATDRGIFYRMRKEAPGKNLLEAPTRGMGATCESCSHCPWMAMNGLKGLERVLEQGSNAIEIDEAIRVKAQISVQRLIDFAADHKSKEVD